MKLRTYSQLIGFCFFATILVGCDACGEKLYIDKEILHSYHSENPIGDLNSKINKFEDSVDVYIDYSNSNAEPLQQSKDMFLFLKDILKDDRDKYNKLGTGGIVSAVSKEFISVNGEYYIFNSNNFANEKSNLVPAIELIVENKNKQSVLITDFEHADEKGTIRVDTNNDGITDKDIRTGIKMDGWANDSFKEWLEYGNSIDVFAHKYVFASGEYRYLPFIVFTPQVNNKKGKVELIKDVFEEKYAEHPNVIHFSFSKNDNAVSHGKIRLFNEEKFRENENAGKNDYIFFEFDKGYLIDKAKYFVSDSLYYINGLEIENYSQIFSDFTFSLKTYNITESYITYERDTLYNNSVKDQDEVFSLVINNLDEEKNSIGLNIDAKNISRTDHNFYRVEVWIENAKRNIPEEEIAKVLSWKDPRGFKVEALEKSIVEAARINYEEQKIFTYYILIKN